MQFRRASFAAPATNSGYGFIRKHGLRAIARASFPAKALAKNWIGVCFGQISRRNICVTEGLYIEFTVKRTILHRQRAHVTVASGTSRARNTIIQSRSRCKSMRLPAKGPLKAARHAQTAHY